MELIQYKGPFSTSDRIIIEPQIGESYVHIGIQVPKIQPITIPETKVSNDTIIKTGKYRPATEDVKISINNKTYQLSDTGILEFDGLSETGWDIRFLTNLPAEAIIDIVRR